MNFFKSILSDDPDPPYPYPEKSKEFEPISPSNPSQQSDEEDDVVTERPSANPNPNSSADSGTSSTTGAGGRSFGGFMKTFATRSESVLEAYRRDLQEFGSGLRKETEIFREVASRAVKDLPASIEVGASVAHGSLESVTHAVDGVIKSTAEIIAHGKETVTSSSDVDSETPDTGGVSGSGRYTRFDAQLNAIQNDVNTFCEEPEDSEEYNKWKLGFSLEGKSEEVENLMGGNGVLEGVYKRVVPNVVDSETFWCRYFYRVHKLKLQENVRAGLVKRAISIHDDEELSWDVEDDNENQLDESVKSKGDELEKKPLVELNSSPIADVGSSSVEKQSETSAAVDKNGEDKTTVDDKCNVAELNEVIVRDEKAKVEESSSQVKKGEKLEEDDEKGDLDGKGGDQGEAGKDIDVSVVASRPSMHREEEEEDMGWDEIEDIGSGDEKIANKNTQGGSPNRTDVRKRLSATEEDEDLSWDIEDDD